MTTVTVATQVAAPVEQVFAVFTDLEHGAERVSNIQEIEVLTTGGFELGTRWLETREVLTQLASAEMEVTAFERNHTYTVTHHKAGARIDAVFTFDPFQGGTRVRIEFNLDSHGLPPGLLAPVGWAIASQVRDVLGQDLADLKKVCGNTTSDPGRTRNLLPSTMVF
jgi:Polyketide cyclase / dehydrase and lipid transport